MRSTEATTEQLQLSISVVCKVIGQIPCFHLYEEHVARRFAATESETALKAMTYNAALDSALMSLRCFNDFFRSDSRLDDIRASDFPGVSMQQFLTSTEKQDIDKYLAHITITRSNIVTKPWMLDDMTIRGLLHGVQFLSGINASFPLHNEAASIELRGVRDIARLLIPKIARPS